METVTRLYVDTSVWSTRRMKVAERELAGIHVPLIRYFTSSPLFVIINSIVPEVFLPNFPIIVEINFDLSKQTPTSPKHISCSLEINNHVPLKYTSCLPYSPQNPWKTLRQISPCPVQSPIKSLPANCDKRGTVPLLKVVRLVQRRWSGEIQALLVYASVIIGRLQLCWSDKSIKFTEE